MQTKTRASAVKIYLFFLFISLFAVSGCGLDIDFGSGNNENTDVKPNETIMGVIEAVPPAYKESSFDIKACVVKDGNEEECHEVAGVSEGEDFSLEANLDPGVKLKIFESGNENPFTNPERLDVFPGVTINIGDITIKKNEDIGYDRDDIDITFNGEVSNDGNCEEENDELTGSIDVTISSEGSITVLITVKLDGANIRGERYPMCHQITSGHEVEVDGKLKANKTVEATIIEIL